MRNINKEIEKTRNALMKVLENFKFRDIYATVDLVREELKKELQQETKVKRTFSDFPSFMEYYISLCRVRERSWYRVQSETISRLKVLSNDIVLADALS